MFNRVFQTALNIVRTNLFRVHPETSETVTVEPPAVWLKIDEAVTCHIAAPTAINIWASLARNGDVTRDKPWMFIVDPGADEEYEWLIAETLEDLWLSVASVESPQIDGWVAIVGPARQGTSTSHRTPEKTKGILLGVALTGTGDVGYAMCKLPEKDYDANAIEGKDIFRLETFMCNIDVTRWLATVANIKKPN